MLKHAHRRCRAGGAAARGLAGGAEYWRTFAERRTAPAEQRAQRLEPARAWGGLGSGGRAAPAPGATGPAHAPSRAIKIAAACAYPASARG